MTIGIDAISFYTTRYFLNLKTLAEQRGADYNKYYVGIGQECMAVAPPDEDVITMGAAAALPLIERMDRSEIDLVLFATESGVDQSKAGGVFIHGLLELPSRCRVVELKQACYSGTMGVQLAAAMVQRGAARKALVIASDIARYELNSPGEATQGAGAVAMIVCAEPKVMALDPEAGYYTADVMDFWRPNYREEALVDGKYSTQVYIEALLNTWEQYQSLTGRTPQDLVRFLYHIPFTKMAEKAHRRLIRTVTGEHLSMEEVERVLGDSLHYSRIAGNCYSASLYVALASLLDRSSEDLGGQRIGLFSYGSGCVGEFYSGVVRKGYREHLLTGLHTELLADRVELTCGQYEDIYHLGFPHDGGAHDFAPYRTGPFRLAGVTGHKRRYERK
jgi:hydroxymethylglutaryl-CoA synthase